MVGLTDKRRWQIRRIFLQRRSDYSLTEAARLLSMKREAFAAKAAELLGRDDDERVTWETLAHVAMHHWPMEVIYESLADEAERVIPHLLRLERLDVKLPAYIIRLLGHLAEADGVSVEEYLRRELADIVESVSVAAPDAIAAIPGAAEAHAFPWRVSR